MLQIGKYTFEQFPCILTAPDFRPDCGLGRFAPAGQLETGLDPDRLGLTDPVDFFQISERKLSKVVEIVSGLLEDQPRQIESRLFRCSCANQNGKKLGITQTIGPLPETLFTRTVLNGQVAYSKNRVFHIP
jgi:hypothetical protein